jgi:L-amino acid N-acyltransferase YncA
MGEKKRRLSAAGLVPATPGPPPILVRPAFEPDLDQITVIYHHHVMTGTGTFDIDPPSYTAMRDRWVKIAAQGWPFLVACDPQAFSRVLGYAYAQPFRERKAYEKTFEDSIYVAPFQTQRGIGKRLLYTLIEDCKALNVRQLLAVIGDSQNTASINLHVWAGFRHVGFLHTVGRKFGRDLDVVLMQRALASNEESRVRG